MKTSHYQKLLALYKDELSGNRDEDALRKELLDARVAEDKYTVAGLPDDTDDEAEYISELEQLLFR